jgi:hypothetical protein
MSVPHSRFGWLLLAAALVWIACAHGLRIQRTLHVTALESWSVAAPPSPLAPPHRLVPITPERAAQETLLLARQGAQQGRWRVTHVDFDNAPEGRRADTPALAPLALRALAGAAGFTTPAGIDPLEWAALLAGPLLHGLLALGGAWLMARRAGPWAAGLFAFVVAGLYPFATEFAPGNFDARALAAFFATLGLVAVVRPAAGSAGWIGGGVLLAIAYSCAPQPVFALVAGAGLGGLIVVRHARAHAVALAGGLALVSLGHTLAHGWSAPADWAALRLTHADALPAAENFAALLGTRGGGGPAAAVLLSVAACALLAGLGARRRDIDSRGLALAGGAALGLAVLACVVVREWRLFGAGALALWAVMLAWAGRERLARTWLGWTTGAACVLLPGVALDWPTGAAAARNALTETETRSLVARDLAWWLARRSGDARAAVFAPPEISPALAYYGGWRGLTSLAPENIAGHTAATLLAAAKTRGEAEAILQQRGVRYVVLPAWDDTLDRLAALARSETGSDGPAPANSFVGALRRLSLPPWLMPLAYPLPRDDGFAAHAVTVFEVVESQEPVTALAQFVDYLLEREAVDAATALLPQLENYPGAPAALAAIALVHAGRRDGPRFQATAARLIALTEADAEWEAPWSARLGLCAVLSQARRPELAKPHLVRFIAGLDAERARQLSAASALRLLKLVRLHAVPLDPAIEALVRDAIPPALRG